MPEHTNKDVVSGFIGLTVVLACRNEMMPARLKPPPASAIATAAATRMRVGTASNGATNEPPHMAPAISTVTAGGGILSSSACIRMIMRHNVWAHRMVFHSMFMRFLNRALRNPPSISVLSDMLGDLPTSSKFSRDSHDTKRNYASASCRIAPTARSFALRIRNVPHA